MIVRKRKLIVRSVMKANDLRIGNIVVNPDNEVKVVCAVLGDEFFELGEKVDDQLVQVNDCEPIPLTEEWLENFGFDGHKDLSESYSGDVCYSENFDFAYVIDHIGVG